MAGMLWYWGQQLRNKQEQRSTAPGEDMSPLVEISHRVVNPYRASIESLLARGRELVAEVDAVPAEERQDIIADELFNISKRIHELVAEEARYLGRCNS